MPTQRSSATERYRRSGTHYKLAFHITASDCNRFFHLFLTLLSDFVAFFILISHSLSRSISHLKLCPALACCCLSSEAKTLCRRSSIGMNILAPHIFPASLCSTRGHTLLKSPKARMTRKSEGEATVLRELERSYKKNGLNVCETHKVLSCG